MVWTWKHPQPPWLTHQHRVILQTELLPFLRRASHAQAEEDAVKDLANQFGRVAFGNAVLGPGRALVGSGKEQPRSRCDGGAEGPLNRVTVQIFAVSCLLFPSFAAWRPAWANHLAAASLPLSKAVLTNGILKLQAFFPNTHSSFLSASKI